MKELELSRDHLVIDYGPVNFEHGQTQLWLPWHADMYLELHGHRYHHRHTLSNYAVHHGHEQSEYAEGNGAGRRQAIATRTADRRWSQARRTTKTPRDTSGAFEGTEALRVFCCALLPVTAVAVFGREAPQALVSCPQASEPWRRL